MKTTLEETIRILESRGYKPSRLETKDREVLIWKTKRDRYAVHFDKEGKAIAAYIYQCSYQESPLRIERYGKWYCRPADSAIRFYTMEKWLGVDLFK